MSTKLSPKSIRNLGVYGVIRSPEVDDILIPDGAVTEAINVQFDRKGAVILRPGLATLGTTVATQVGYPIWGLHNTQNGTMLAVVSQGASARVYAYGGASWASNLTSGTANAKIRFVNFADRIICLNWGGSNMYSSIQVWAGRENNAAWITSGGVINPQAITNQVAPSPQPQYGEVYKSRLYLAGGDTDGSNLRLSRLWFSSVISSTGIITWTPASDYVDINPNDGENITGLKRFSLELLVFKPNYIYRFRTSGVDPDPLIKIGTRSQESIVEGKRGLYFHHDTGFYRYSGGYPIEISRPISDVVVAIPYSQFATINAWKDSDHIFWSLGNLTISSDPSGDVTWSNGVIRYTESSEVWTIYSYPNEIRFGSDYNTGAALSRVVGTTHGVVATFDSGTTDYGEPIEYWLRTKWYEWEGIFTNKIIQQLVAICEKAQGSELMYQIENENTSWKTIGQIRKFLNFYNNTNIRFHRIRFRLNGISTSEAFIFKGLEITDGINEGIIE